MDLPLVTVLALLLAFSMLFDAIFRRLGLNPIPGYVLAGFTVGLIIGGDLDHVVLDGIAYVSLLLFMLYVGLSVRTGEVGLDPYAVPVGLSGFLTTMVLTYITLATLGFEPTLSILLSILLSNTSTETVAATLDKRRVLSTYKWLVDTSFIDDIVTVILTTMVISAWNTNSGLTNIFFSTAKTLLFLAAIYVALRAVSKRRLFYKYISSSPTVFSTLSITILLALAAISKASGLTEIIGAYFAGLLISYGRKIHDPTLKTQIVLTKFIDELSTLLNSFFIPLFFTTVGLSFKLGTVVWHTLLALLIPIVIAKPLGTTLLINRRVKSLKKSVKLGFLMNSRGALEIALLKYLVDRGLISDAVFSTIVALTLISAILAPLSFIKEG